MRGSRTQHLGQSRTFCIIMQLTNGMSTTFRRGMPACYVYCSDGGLSLQQVVATAYLCHLHVVCGACLPSMQCLQTLACLSSVIPQKLMLAVFEHGLFPTFLWPPFVQELGFLTHLMQTAVCSDSYPAAHTPRHFCLQGGQQKLPQPAVFQWLPPLLQLLLVLHPL